MHNQVHSAYHSFTSPSIYLQKSYKNACAETVSMDIKSALKKGAFKRVSKKLWPRQGLNPAAWFYKHRSCYDCGLNKNAAQLSVGLPCTSAFNML